jgi:hypothetical protein
MTSNGGGGVDGEKRRYDNDVDDDNDIVPCIKEDGNIIEETQSFLYRPPARTLSTSVFTKLKDPLSLREALWRSTVLKKYGRVEGVSVSGRGQTAGTADGPLIES